MFLCVRWREREPCVTSRVPVDVCDVTGRSFADPHSLTAQHVVDVHEAVVWRHSQEFTGVWDHDVCEKMGVKMSRYRPSLSTNTPLFVCVCVYLGRSGRRRWRPGDGGSLPDPPACQRSPPARRHRSDQPPTLSHQERRRSSDRLEITNINLVNNWFTRLVLWWLGILMLKSSRVGRHVPSCQLSIVYGPKQAENYKKIMQFI